MALVIMTIVLPRTTLELQESTWMTMLRPTFTNLTACAALDIHL